MELPLISKVVPLESPQPLIKIPLVRPGLESADAVVTSTPEIVFSRIVIFPLHATSEIPFAKSRLESEETGDCEMFVKVHF